MGFFSSLFGKKSAPEPAPAVATPTNNTTMSRPKCGQVYMARATELPEWAQNVTTSELLLQLKQHCVCKFVPNFEVKKIMSTNIGADGNLVAEYDGIAGDCGAIKQFGARVSQQLGNPQNYKYFDPNNAYRACCGNPKKCPFYLCAVGENETVNARRR